MVIGQYLGWTLMSKHQQAESIPSCSEIVTHDSIYTFTLRLLSLVQIHQKLQQMNRDIEFSLPPALLTFL